MRTKILVTKILQLILNQRKGYLYKTIVREKVTFFKI